MKKYLYKIITTFLLMTVFNIQLCESYVYSGITYTGVEYSGIEIEPIKYDGITIYPLSYTGSVIEGICYEGFNLSDYKITVHKITGNETSDDFYLSSVKKQYRVDWKKVLSKYAVGTTVIVITGVLALSTGPSGYIAATAFSGAVSWAVSGAAISALIAGTLSALKGENKKVVFKESIEASADGFMWGAITGAIAGIYNME